jgi:hypothetical protein
VRGGVPITDAFETVQGNEASYFTNTKRYVIGPAIEFHLPGRLLIGVDGLYKRLGFEFQETAAGVSAATVANSWTFPAMLKWEFIPGPVRPFAGIGGSLRHVSGIEQVRNVLGNVTDVDPVEFNKRNDVGLVFGGGLAIEVGRLRIIPEFRYTRWGSETFRDPVRSFLRTNRNEGDFLLGLTF